MSTDAAVDDEPVVAGMSTLPEEIASRSAEDFMRAHRARMNEISKRGIKLVSSLAIFNSKMIFRMANGQLREDVRVPESELAAFEAVMLEGLDV